MSVRLPRRARVENALGRGGDFLKLVVDSQSKALKEEANKEEMIDDSFTGRLLIPVR